MEKELLIDRFTERVVGMCYIGLHQMRETSLGKETGNFPMWETAGTECVKREWGRGRIEGTGHVKENGGCGSPQVTGFQMLKEEWDIDRLVNELFTYCPGKEELDQEAMVAVKKN